MTLKNDWQRVNQLAQKLLYCDADKALREKARIKLLRYLQRLEKRHSDNIDIIASHADFLHNKKRALELYLKAYDLARKNSDDMNCTLISSSIVNLYLHYYKDIVNADRWMGQFSNDLTVYSDKDCKDEFDEYQNTLKTLKEEKRSKRRCI